MRLEFCTILDVNFLPRGLVLHRSLQETSHDFRLRIFCADEHVEQLLRRLELPRVEVIGICELEAYDPDLVGVKPSRTREEYCWTAKPSICRYALERASQSQPVTFVDADIMFYRDPALLLAELGGDSILLVPHRATMGRPCIYNAGLMTFRNDENGRAAANWWRARCLEWCYDREEDGKHGDQGYLDAFPKLFAGVHELRHLGGIVAPWNATRHRLTRVGEELSVEGQPLIFYHHQSLHLLRATSAVQILARLPQFHFNAHPLPLVWTTYPGYAFDKSDIELLWKPYVARLAQAIRDVQVVQPGFRSGFVRDDLKGLALEVARQVLPERVKQKLLATDRLLRIKVHGTARSRPRYSFD